MGGNKKIFTREMRKGRKKGIFLLVAQSEGEGGYLEERMKGRVV